MAMTAKQLQAVMARIAVTAQLLAPYQLMPVIGQSNAMGANGTVLERDAATRLDRAGVAMLAGLKRSDNAAINIIGPLTLGYNLSVPATGLVSAAIETNAPMCHYIAAALRYRRAQAGLANPTLIVGFNGIPGQSINEFDNDPATGGAQGVTIYQSSGYWTAEAARLAASVTVPWAGILQGEADVSMAAGAYTTAANRFWGQYRSQHATLTGSTPRPWAGQIGGYTNTLLPAYHVLTEQVLVVEALGGRCPAPGYPVLLADNVVHYGDAGYRELADVIAWDLAECEAGREAAALYPTPTLMGSQLVLTYPLRPGVQLRLADAAKYAAYGGVSNSGFEVTGASISSVTLGGDGASVVLDCTAPPSAWSYAYQARDVTSYSPDGLANYAAHRGLLHTTETAAGYLTSTPIRRWALSWRGSL